MASLHRMVVMPRSDHAKGYVMPRINAPTVADHRAQRIRAILDAARRLMEETGEPPSMGEIGSRAGLARSSVYQYFSSVEELLTAVAAEVFPDWIERVLERVAEAPTSGDKVWAYIEENIAIFASPELAVAQVLARVISPQEFQAPMKEFHVRLQVPLKEALADLGEPDPEAMAQLIDALIMKATSDRSDEDPHETNAGDSSLALLRRLLGPYLGLRPET